MDKQNKIDDKKILEIFNRLSGIRWELTEEEIKKAQA